MYIGPMGTDSCPLGIVVLAVSPSPILFSAQLQSADDAINKGHAQTALPKD